MNAQSKQFEKTAPALAISKQLQNSFNPDAPQLEAAMKLMTQLVNNATEIPVPHPPIKFPVFQGGGAKGVAYVGAFSALDEQGYLDEITCPGGASAGAMTAFFIGLGFNSEQFSFISEHLDFTDLMDLKKEGWGAYLNGSKVGIGMDLLKYGATYDGKSFHVVASSYLEQILGDKNATFRDLHDKKADDPTLKDMLFVATHLGERDHAQQVFSYETTPDVVIADAVRASMAFPGAFTPWEIRQKTFDANHNHVAFKSLGFFSDGGILNNFPVDAYNRKAYAEPHFSFVESIDKQGQAVQINPSILGFSLTQVEELDERITPLTPRLKFMHNVSHLYQSEKLIADETVPSWHFWDLLKAVFWNTVGKPEIEDVQDKQKMYAKHVVQICPEDMSTLEFNAPKDKIAQIIENGKNATLLWLDRDHNENENYQYAENFHDSLNRKDEQKLINNPKDFYFERLNKLFISFMNELGKQSHKGRISNDEISQNVNLRYFAGQIIKYSQLANDVDNNMSKEAFESACQNYSQQRKLIKQNRLKRWDMIIPEQVVVNVKANLQSYPEKAFRIMRSQLSNVIALVQKNDSELLRALIATDNVEIANKGLDIILNALKQKYYQSKIRNPKAELAKILNACSPSLAKIAFAQGNQEMIQLLQNKGVNMIDSIIGDQDILSEIHSEINSLNLEELGFDMLTIHQPALILSNRHSANDSMLKLTAVKQALPTFEVLQAQANKL